MATQDPITADADASGGREDRHTARRADHVWKPERLRPPEAFDDTQASTAERRYCGLDLHETEVREHSRTVAGRLRMSCAGWTTVPTAEEFHRAVHEPTGTARETAILLTWYHEADTLEQMNARLEGAYSWRELVRALHRVGLTRGEGARRINRFARR